MPTPEERRFEMRLRRAADRQRKVLVKSRRRDPRAYDYGWVLVEKTPKATERALKRLRDGHGRTLEEVAVELGEHWTGSVGPLDEPQK